jgi:hypothetical protein
MDAETREIHLKGMCQHVFALVLEKYEFRKKSGLKSRNITQNVEKPFR